MKSIIYAALLLVATVASGLSAAAQHFTCAQYDADAKRWQEIEQVFKRQGWSQWALAVKDAYPLNTDRAIQYRYILVSDVPCAQKRLSELVQKWITFEYPGVQPVSGGQTVDIKVQSIWDNVAHSYRVFTSAYVSAKSETFVELKDNRLRITVTVPRYVMGAASPFEVNSDTPLVGECYPFDLNGKWKNVLSMAYVNSNLKALEQVKSLLDYLNRHSAVPSKADKDW